MRRWKNLRFVFVMVVIFSLNLAHSTSTRYTTSQNNKNVRTSPSHHQQRSHESHRAHGSNDIPLSMILKLNAVRNEQEFLEKFVEDGHSTRNLGVGNRLTSRSDDELLPVIREGRQSDVRRTTKARKADAQYAALAALPGVSPKNTLSNNGVAHLRTAYSNGESTRAIKKTSNVPTFASCSPENRTVELRDTDDPTLYYYPSCTRIERCGGCCSTELLACRPTSAQFVNFTVHVSKYVGKSKLEYRGTKQITVEKHLKCNCECRVKPEDCTSQQRYEENDCRCVCTNKEDEEKCASEEKIKLWNPSTCQCQCREIYECPSENYFDETRCRCMKHDKSSGFLPPDYGFNQRRYYGPPFV